MTRFHLKNKGFLSFENHLGKFDFFVPQENFGSGHANYKKSFCITKARSTHYCVVRTKITEKNVVQNSLQITLNMMIIL